MLTTEQRAEFEKRARPLIAWLNDNCHPHMKIVITPTSGEVVEGVFFFPTHYYLRD